MSAMKLLIVIALSAAACKGSTEVKDNPETLEELKDCKKELVGLKQQASVNATGDNDAIAVEIEGDIATIVAKDKDKASSRGDAGTKDIPARTAALAKSVKGARGSLQRCYQQELKTNTKLQGKPTTLRLQMKFDPAGKAKSFSISPSISSTFKACLRGHAMKWNVPASSGSHNIGARINLTPQ